MGCCLSAPDGDDVVPEATFVSATHEFTILRYSQTRGHGRDKYISSQFFIVDGRRWYIRFYPYGYGTDRQSWEYIAFFVQTLYKPLCAVRAHFNFTLLKPDDSVAYRRRSITSSNFDRRCNCWGFPKFIRRDKLESALLGVLHHDSIRVRCTLDVVKKARGRRIDAAEFLGSGGASFDVKFSVDGVTFEAHKLVVSARSDWFAAAIYGHRHGDGKETSWAEATMQCIAIEGTSRRAFEGVLHYIYNNTLPPEADAVMTRELFEAADMFLIERLKKMCADRMCLFIQDDTVESILELAKAHSCKELERECQYYMASRRAIVSHRSL